MFFGSGPGEPSGRQYRCYACLNRVHPVLTRLDCRAECHLEKMGVSDAFMCLCGYCICRLLWYLLYACVLLGPFVQRQARGRAFFALTDVSSVETLHPSALAQLDRQHPSLFALLPSPFTMTDAARRVVELLKNNFPGNAQMGEVLGFVGERILFHPRASPCTDSENPDIFL